jgi:hypothetical protein
VYIRYGRGILFLGAANVYGQGGLHDLLTLPPPPAGLQVAADQILRFVEHPAGVGRSGFCG